MEKYQVIKEELDLGCGEAQSDKSVLVEGIGDGEESREGRKGEMMSGRAMRG